MHSAESKWDSEDIIDTKKLQLFALKEFMAQLHYEYDEDFLWCSPRFFSLHHSNKGREQISVNTAIKLYNGNSVKCVFGKPPSTLSIWSFDDFTITKAKAARILRQVKLQSCKKTGMIICQDHRIQVITASYAKLFLYNKHL